ncbi:hypothetical protein [Metabacillus idriensis]|uniref:hypothetical protein n=1 Tax=Metabacillus idriensis TaxID=324768 RepID=UPI00174EA8A5|nr:hypothetical protein [Metabacillus idriensis]
MKDLNVRIGDHYIKFVYIEEKIFNLLTKQFTPFNGNPFLDMTIKIHKGSELPFTSYDVYIQNHSNIIEFIRADYKINVDYAYKSAQILAHSELALKHAIMNLYSSFIVHKNWGILLHSSCVLENDGAHIFTGHSGAGKSTAAKLSAPRPLLSDEATIIKIDKDRILAYDSPFRSELYGHAPVSDTKLLSIDLLHQSLSIERNRVDKSSALLALFDKVFYWPSNKEETKRILTMLRFLVEQVDIYDLYFQKNNQFWEMIS